MAERGGLDLPTVKMFAKSSETDMRTNLAISAAFVPRMSVAEGLVKWPIVALVIVINPSGRIILILATSVQLRFLSNAMLSSVSGFGISNF
ncbi:hypothetical protein OIU74_014028 [Salix koriyanagi]|uniref:Uncharacterized protein n=1 Tax=Salix koriyanagi TaxID=2511006 RepID=A0A9Q0SYX0_9ROSI|nr:hypothetical protein OIU74_014028 [Salix koriyanagi]